MALPEAHLNPPKGMRGKASSRAYPMAEHPNPVPDLASADHDGRIATLRRVVEWFDVETSDRWLSRDTKTYCNVYAHDFCRSLGAYLPRVWWDAANLARIMAGESVEAIYPGRKAGTIREANANALRGWIPEHGPSFGWLVIQGNGADTSTGARARMLRQYLNRTGSFGLICASNRDRNRSGHITVALPDAVFPTSVGASSPPIQTQAGSRNRRLFASEWYNLSQYDAVVFAVFRLPTLDRQC